MALMQIRDNVQLNVEIHEGLAEVDTVFLHGNLASNTWWQPALAEWQTRSAGKKLPGRLIFAEWRGCGKSPAPQSEADLHPSILADDYVQLLQKLQVKKACLVGHSTGGLIGLYAILKAPALFERALLLDSVGAKGVQLDPAILGAFTQMSQDRGLCEAVMGATIHGNDPSSALFRQIVDDTMNVAKEIWHGVPNALSKIDIVNELSRIQQPVLVLHGEHDALIPKADSMLLAEKLGNARYMELAGQGHSTNVENPARFVQLAKTFLYAPESTLADLQ